MSKRRGPWADGHRAWERLVGWHTAGRAGAEAGDAALDAMADIGTMRRLLDQAELAAVRSARRHRRSWAEIATQLGITRQSAWERWRELDETPTAIGTEPTHPSLEAVSSDVAADLVDDVISAEAAEKRRHAKVVVPNVVGMTWDEARDTLRNAGLQAVGSDPDGPSLAALGWPNIVVVDQVPESGAKVPAGTSVRVWVERGGGSAGVREPRRPSPTPKSGYEWRDELTDEAVG